MTDQLDVHVEILGETLRAGTAFFHRRRDRLTTDFTYDRTYLADDRAYPLDPLLPLDARRGFTDGLPGAWSDCAPDRWGRRLITKRIRATEPESRRSLSDVDFLVGVSDSTRQGALRFALPGSSEFLASRGDVPKMLRLPELLRASDQVEATDTNDLAAVKKLLDAGTASLGGARPKASVIGDAGQLMIAKFPHATDEWDVMAWEKTALDLAESAGIDVPARQLVTVDERSVLLVDRFDREGGERVGYQSFMTMAGAADGGRDRDYVDLAEDLADVSVGAGRDLRELWRRIAFSVVIHNVDDHLRNHGLLRSGGGWRMAPAFDLNPDPDPSRARVTGIGGAVTREEERQALLAHAAVFGLTETEAAAHWTDVVDATREWRIFAAGNGIRESELERFAPVLDWVVNGCGGQPRRSISRRCFSSARRG